MPHVIDLPLSSLAFPERCIRCSAPAHTTFPIGKWKGYDLLFFHIGRYYSVAAPVCGGCTALLRVFRIAALTVAILSAVVAIIFFFLVEDHLKAALGTTPTSIMSLVVIFGPAIFIRRSLESQINAQWLGLALRDVNQALGRIVLWVKRDELARSLQATSALPPAFPLPGTVTSAPSA